MILTEMGGTKRKDQMPKRLGEPPRGCAGKAHCPNKACPTNIPIGPETIPPDWSAGGPVMTAEAVKSGKTDLHFGASRGSAIPCRSLGELAARRRNSRKKFSYWDYPTMSSRIAFVLMLVLPPSFVAAEDQAAPRSSKPNELFIAVDDLRPQLACYGKSFMKTPGFDSLARRGLLFERSFCMVPTCGASQASLMTGIRPSPSRFVSYTARADKDAPDSVTLNTHFQSNGYTTASLGKIFHFPADSAQGWTLSLIHI